MKILNRKGTYSPPKKPRFQNVFDSRKEKRQFRFNVFSIVSALAFSVIGIYLGKQANDLNEKMLEIPQKQDSTSIDLLHFKKLLSKTDTVITELAEQVKLSREQQQIANQNSKYTGLSNENKFYSAIQKLSSIVVNSLANDNHISKWDSIKKERFLNDADEILLGEFNNPFLTSNKDMFNDWVAAHDSVHDYRVLVAFSHQLKDPEIAKENNMTYENAAVRIKNKLWNCFATIANLQANTQLFADCYKKSKSTSGQCEYRKVKKSRLHMLNK